MMTPDNLTKVPKAERERHEQTLRELAGRMYESCDIMVCIERGEYKTLDDLAKRLKQQQSRLDRTIRAAMAGETFEFKDCCVVLKP